MEEYLAVKHINKSFGGNHALKDVSFSLDEGKIHVICGENGAGKSTILKILSGVFREDSGELFFKGQKIEIDNPQQAIDLGIGMVYQELSLIRELTVEENLFLNREPKTKAKFIDTKLLTEKVLQLEEQYGIDVDPKRIVARLSIAEQQMVEILKVLLKESELIILDEPTSSLSTKEVEKLFEIMRKLIEMGKTIIFISHRMEEVFRIGDTVTIFKDGEFIKTMPVSEVTENELIRMMVGRPLQDVYPPKAEVIGDEVLFEAKINKPGVLNNVELQVHKGEILGIAGLQGHGQTELLNALSGMESTQTSEIKVKGQSVRIRNSRQAIKHGIALVPVNRGLEGLMLRLPIRQNLSICTLDKISRFGIVNFQKEREKQEATREALKIKAHSLNLPVNSLSGGNQQKIVLGKELAIDPEVVLFNDPTRGIDVGAKNDFYNIMRNLANQGTAVIMSSSDMMEVIGMCDRILVMYEGSVTAVLEKDDITEETIMKHAVGVSQ